MTGESLPPSGLDQLATVFQVIDAAMGYGYSIEAAARAAMERLADVDQADAVMVAALLAALVVVDLRPRDADDLAAWSSRYAVELIGRES